MTADDDFMISRLAGRIAEKRKAMGQELIWPPEKNQPGVPRSLQYPREIWHEAQRQWMCMSPSVRKAEKKQYREEIDELLTGAIANLRRLGFGSSFGVLNLLWIAVSVLAAICVGSGKADFLF